MSGYCELFATRPPAIQIFQPLRRAPVALLWGGLTLSALGDQLYAVALTWIAVGVFGSNAAYLSALQAFVMLLAVLGVGRWADRWDRQRSMIGADLARAIILLAVVAIWLATNGPSAGLLMAAIVVLALGQAVFQPALQSVLPSLIRDRQLLPAANGLLDMTDRSARLLGPGLIALLAGILPVEHFLTLDAVSFLGSAAAVALITRLVGDQPAGPPPRHEPLWQGIMRGTRAMTAHPLLGYALATTGLLNGAWFSVYSLDLPLMLDRHGIGLEAYGAILSAYGCSNLAANLVLGSRKMPARPQFQMYAGHLVQGVALVCLGCANWLPDHWVVPGCIAAAACGAAGGPMKDIPLAVLRQTRLRLTDIAAGMRVTMAASSLGMLVAMALTPTAIAVLGVVPVMALCGAAYLGVAAIGLLRFAALAESPGEQPV